MHNTARDSPDVSYFKSTTHLQAGLSRNRAYIIGLPLLVQRDIGRPYWATTALCRAVPWWGAALPCSSARHSDHDHPLDTSSGRIKHMVATMHDHVVPASQRMACSAPSSTGLHPPRH